MTTQVSKLIGESINAFFETMSLKSIICLFFFSFIPIVIFYWTSGTKQDTQHHKIN